jgi:hypothetical protein
MDETSEMIRENIKRFKRYTNSVINPLTIAELVDELDAVHIKNVDRGQMEAPKMTTVQESVKPNNRSATPRKDPYLKQAE